ncbi:hypothetical protein ACO0SA_001691 [Hanseniaspora valbyensis]
MELNLTADNENFENITSLTLVNNLPQDYDFKFVSIYKSLHIFLATSENDNNDIFHYIKDGNQFVLLFKHDYSEFNELDSNNEESVKITDMKVLENIDTLIVLYSNGNLKTFTLPDLMYNYKADLQNIKQIEIINNQECLLLTNDGLLNSYKFSKNNELPKQQKWLTINNIKTFSETIKKKGNEFIFIILNENLEYLLITTNKSVKEHYESKLLCKLDKDCFSDNLNVYFKKLNENNLMFLKKNKDSQTEFVTTKCDGEIINEIKVKNDPIDITSLDENYVFIKYETSTEILNFSNKESIETINNITNTQRIDNYLSLDWEMIKSFEKGSKFLDFIKSKYLLQPLIQDPSGNQIAIDIQSEQENLFIEKNYEYKSNILIFSHDTENNKSLEFLIKPPVTTKLKNFEQETLDICDKLIKKLSNEGIKEFNSIQLQYAKYYKLLLHLFHNDVIDITCFQNWINMAAVKDSTLDVKLLFYILNWKVYGDIWINKGLLKIIEKLKILKLESKIADKMLFLSNILIILTNDKISKNISDIFHLKKTVTLKYIEYVLEKKDDDDDDNSSALIDAMNIIDVEQFGEDIINYVKESKESKFKNQLLLHLYERKNDFLKVLEIAFKMENYKKMDEIFTSHFKDIPYKEDKDLFLKYIIVLINNCKDINSNLLKNINAFIKGELTGIESRKAFINELTNNNIKFQLLENIIKNSSNKSMDLDTISFTLDLYILEIERVTIKHNNFNALLNNGVTDFEKDMDFKNKITLQEYCNQITKNEKGFLNLQKRWLGFIETIESSESSKEYKFLIENKFSKNFDKNDILFFLFKMTYILSKETKLSIYLKYNDFKSLIELLENNKNKEFDELFLKVLENYKNEEIIFLKFLNSYSENQTGEIFLKILDIVPNTIILKLLRDFVLKNINNLEITEKMVTFQMCLQNVSQKEK